MDIKQFQGNKEFTLTDFKAAEKDGVVRISGYANNKHMPDRYGDIPTEYNRPYVYDLDEFRLNPVLLLDHCHAVRNMVGSVTTIYEDERGLYFEADISQSDLPEIKHARKLIQEGHLRTVSIGGIWSFEDPQNPSHLTLAKIFEISLVAVPADPYALVQAEPAPEPAKQAAQPDYKRLEDKLFAFEMGQKINRFEAKINKPVLGKGANK